MESNKKLNNIIILLVVLLVLSIYQNIKVQREIIKIRHTISDMDNNVNFRMDNLRSLITNNFSRLDEMHNIVSDYSSTYKSIDVQKGTVKTLVKFNLKQSDGESKVYLNVSKANNEQGKDYECTPTDGLNYACEVDLSIKDNYIFNIYQKSDNGNIKKLNYFEYHSDIRDDFENRTHISIGATYGSYESICDFSLMNNTFGEQNYKVKSVVLKAFYKDKEVFSKDVTNFNSGISTDEYGNEYGKYTVNILNSETGVPGKNNSIIEYYFKVIVTFNNGEVYEKNSTDDL